MTWENTPYELQRPGCLCYHNGKNRCTPDACPVHGWRPNADPARIAECVKEKAKHKDATAEYLKRVSTTPLIVTPSHLTVPQYAKLHDLKPIDVRYAAKVGKLASIEHLQTTMIPTDAAWAPLTRPAEELAKRNALILNSHIFGFTAEQIAADFGISATRVRQIVKEVA